MRVLVDSKSGPRKTFHIANNVFVKKLVFICPKLWLARCPSSEQEPLEGHQTQRSKARFHLALAEVSDFSSLFEGRGKRGGVRVGGRGASFILKTRGYPRRRCGVYRWREGVWGGIFGN